MENLFPAFTRKKKVRLDYIYIHICVCVCIIFLPAVSQGALIQNNRYAMKAYFGAAFPGPQQKQGLGCSCNFLLLAAFPLSP